jgi:predicted TIM-barrel fold metal-dependent hydrolase
LIIDSHCHSWQYWPYQNKNNHEPNQIPVPNPETWGNIDQLNYEMKINNIDYATIVSAQIWHNPNNNNYINGAIKNQKNLFQFIDFDSYWSETYQTYGALERFEKNDISENVIGITHYLGEDDGEWLISNEGKKLFKTINEKKMIVSISCKPKHSKNIKKLAEFFPKMPILLHHMGGMKSNLNDKSENNNILKLSKFKNIFLKFSGYNYVLGEDRRWDFPYNDALWVYKEAYQKFGSNMVWGSDFPVVKFSSTYKQAFEVFNKYCDFMSENDKNLIQGNNLLKLIKERGKID